MIEGHCHTNMDGYERIDWPTLFVSVPKEGDWVESLCGKRVLRVVKIKHQQDNYQGKKVPKISVELTKCV
jgi:hypothetical protein